MCKEEALQPLLKNQVGPVVDKQNVRVAFMNGNILVFSAAFLSVFVEYKRNNVSMSSEVTSNDDGLNTYIAAMSIMLFATIGVYMSLLLPRLKKYAAALLWCGGLLYIIAVIVDLKHQNELFGIYSKMLPFDARVSIEIARMSWFARPIYICCLIEFVAGDISFDMFEHEHAGRRVSALALFLMVFSVLSGAFWVHPDVRNIIDYNVGGITAVDNKAIYYCIAVGVYAMILSCLMLMILYASSRVHGFHWMLSILLSIFLTGGGVLYLSGWSALVHKGGKNVGSSYDPAVARYFINIIYPYSMACKDAIETCAAWKVLPSIWSATIFVQSLLITLDILTVNSSKVTHAFEEVDAED